MFDGVSAKLKLGLDLDLCANHLSEQSTTLHREITVLIGEKKLLAAMAPLKNYRSTTLKVATLAPKECGRTMRFTPNLVGIDIPLIGAAR